jgi:predicted ArsR family transcriptional regulator
MAVNTARDHLRVLEDEGLIRGAPRQQGTRGRPSVVFHAVREASSNVRASERIDGARDRGTLMRAVIGGGTGLTAQELAQIDVVWEHLDDAGLEPEIDETGLTFDLKPCHFHRLVPDDRALLCSVHACLVRDVLSQVGGPLEVQRLDPFVTANKCQLVLESPPSAG